MSELKEKAETLPEYPYHLPGDQPPPPGKISYEAFLEWADEDTHAEWVDGEIEMTSPAGRQHQRLVTFLDRIMGIFVELNDLGEIYTMGLQMKLPGKRGSGREPDLLFVKKEHLSRLEPGLLRGPADLVVEIASPEKRDQERDRVKKFREYAAAGIPEYWLIDPTQNQALFYQLGSDKQYREGGLDGEGRYFSPTLPGFWLKPEWLWQSSLPQVNDVLLDVAGEAYARYMLAKLQQRGFLPPK